MTVDSHVCVDAMLDGAERGLGYFATFVPLFEDWTDGQRPADVDQARLRALYDEQRGLDLGVLAAGRDQLGRQLGIAAQEAENQRAGVGALPDAWRDSAAADRAATALGAHLDRADTDLAAMRDAHATLSTAVDAIHAVMQLKAEYVDALGNVGTVGDAGPKQIAGMIHLARTGRRHPIFPMFGMSEQDATEWLDTVFVPEVTSRVEDFVAQCRDTATALEQIYRNVVEAMQAVDDSAYPGLDDPAAASGDCDCASHPGTMPGVYSPGAGVPTVHGPDSPLGSRSETLPGSGAQAPPGADTTAGTGTATGTGTAMSPMLSASPVLPDTGPEVPTDPATADVRAPETPPQQQPDARGRVVDIGQVLEGLGGAVQVVAGAIVQAAEQVAPVIESVVHDAAQRVGDLLDGHPDTDGLPDPEAPAPVPVDAPAASARFELNGRTLRLEPDSGGSLNLAVADPTGAVTSYALTLDPAGTPVLTRDTAPSCEPEPSAGAVQPPPVAGSPTAPRLDLSAGPEPAAPEPVVPEPAAPEPVVPEPAATELAVPEITAPEPVAPGPVVPEPAATELAVPKLTAPEPVTPEPVAPEPAQPGPVAPTVGATPAPRPQPQRIDPAPGVPDAGAELAEAGPL